MVTWGIVAMLFTWVSSINGLYALRFFLGVAEAGFFPGPSSISAPGCPAATAPRSWHSSISHSR